MVLPADRPEHEISVCESCLSELIKPGKPDNQYWRFLTDTMWSTIPAVQVMAWRILSRLRDESWAAESLDMLYLDEETLAWAQAAGEPEVPEISEIHRDGFGNELQNGDTVVLTRSLDVKGSSLNAKMGTVVKNIRLVPDNNEQIEGRIDGQVIVILTKYLRKQRN